MNYPLDDRGCLVGDLREPAGCVLDWLGQTSVLSNETLASRYHNGRHVERWMLQWWRFVTGVEFRLTRLIKKEIIRFQF